MKTTPTSILDPCCGGRMFYFDKNHPNILYCDQRSEVVEMKARGKVRTLEINSDILRVLFRNIRPAALYKRW